MGLKPKKVSIVFYVSDIARTEAFYNETLGLGLERMEGAEPFWLQGTIEDGPGLIFFEMDGVRGNTPAIVFDLDEGGIDDVVAELAQKGVNIVTPVSEAPGGWSADFLDPDGFGLGLWQSGDLPRSLK
jgi:glyoxylase I family protein